MLLVLLTTGYATVLSKGILSVSSMAQTTYVFLGINRNYGHLTVARSAGSVCTFRHSLISFEIIVLLMVGNWVNAVSPTHPGPCTFKKTTEEPLAVDCSARGLTEVPGDLPEDVTSLNLNENNIKILTNVSFARYPALHLVSLESNGLMDIQEGAFHRLVFLESLILAKNKLSCLPNNMLAGNKRLKIISVSSNNLTSLPVHAFASLKTLDKLLLAKNPLWHLNFSGFVFTNISRLDLISTNISSVQMDDFLALKETSIYYFDLSLNNITNLPDGVFQHLKYVTLMDLSLNSVHTLSFNAFVGMESLEILVAKHINVHLIKGFSDNVTNTSVDVPPLRNITFAFNHIRVLGPNVFVGLDKLAYLDLRYCMIKSLENDTFSGLVSLRTLDLSWNDINFVTAGTFSNLQSLHTLLLPYNKFKVFDPFLFRDLKVTYLDLSGNPIQDIKTNDWNSSHVKTLDLSGISIGSLQGAPFRGLKGLQSLILSSSSIRQLTPSSFEGLTSLIELDLSKLGVLQDFNKPFTNLNGLLSLDFSYNYVTHLTTTFRGLISLQELKLRHSNLVAISLYNDGSAFSYTPNLTDLSLKGNQLEGMFPETLGGLTRLITLDMSDCRMASLNPAIFRDLISLRQLFLEHNSIALISPDHLRSLHSLSGFKLQNNKLQGVLDKDLFRNNRNLSYVSLSNNGLTGIAQNTYLPMKLLDLYGNPLTCTCDLLWFRQYLKTSNLTVNNLDRTICSTDSLPDYVQKSLLDFNPEKECGPNTAVYILTSLLILFCLIGMALAYKYRWWLNYKFFHIKLLVVGYYELEDGREHLDYDYDVDVIFPDDDEPWVKNEFLVALVDHAPDFARDRIVCGEDDLPLGGVRMDAIDYVIENSFKIVVIVSNASVNDAHFLTQLQMAVEHMNEVQLEKVVMVFREDVPDNQLPYLVRLFLSKNKPYFEWTDDLYGQKLFWEKLMKMMRCNKKMNGLLPI